MGAEDLQMKPKKIWSAGSHPKLAESSFGAALRIFAERCKKLDRPLVHHVKKREPAALPARGGMERELWSHMLAAGP